MRSFLRVPSPLKPCRISVDLFDSDIAEGNFIAVAAEADVACLLTEPRMVSSVDRLAFWRHIIKVNIQNGGAVQYHSNLAAVDGDFLTVPQARGHEMALFGWRNAIARTVVLPVF